VVDRRRPRLDASEQRISNLLEITGFAPVTRSASTPCRDQRMTFTGVIRADRQPRAWVPGWALSSPTD
jgi:hypothetical protein